MTKAQANQYKRHVASMDADELENETYTLRHERRYLDNLTDEQVAERLAICEAETTRRIAARFES